MVIFLLDYSFKDAFITGHCGSCCNPSTWGLMQEVSFENIYISCLYIILRSNFLCLTSYSTSLSWTRFPNHFCFANEDKQLFKMGRGWGGGVTRWMGDVSIEAVRSPDMSEEIPQFLSQNLVCFISVYIFYFVCMNILLVHMYTFMPTVLGPQWISWYWSYEWLWASMWMLKSNPGSL